MVKTLGLSHIALPVKDVKRAFLFYQKIFGVREMYQSAGFIQAQTPGSKDIIVFEKGKNFAKTKPGFHFGFRLTKPSDTRAIIETIKKAGGAIKSSGEFVPGEPYVFFTDPDGYEVEIWYEKIPESLKSFK
ncbi:MAG TPA: VOC family protein [Chitinophagaceae bacterium]|jgi:catechol 2,3-dioxygenase-like lactoylglutathione lyase family enzyme|nr:VOC family protein [Chitinophagaceae bacterium]